MTSQLWFSLVACSLFFACSPERIDKTDAPISEVRQHLDPDLHLVGWHAHGTKLYPPTELHGPGALLDPGETPFRIEAISWYGFETRDGVAHGLWSNDYRNIVDLVQESGFNTIRIPFSNEMWRSSAIVRNSKLSGCSACQGLTGKEILALIIDYAKGKGLQVILDNHRSDGGNSAQENGLWYTDGYPEPGWIADWLDIQTWVNDNGWQDVVVGYELRNEPHTVDKGRNSGYLNGSTWGSGDGAAGPNPDPFSPSCVASSSCNDWRLAAERAGTLLLGEAADNGWHWPLIIVDGVGRYPKDSTVPADNDTEEGWWGGMLEGVNGNSSNDGAPIVFNLGRDQNGVLGAPVDGQLVYSAHDYGPDLYQQTWFNTSTCYLSGCSASSLVDVWYGKWGFVTDDVDPASSGTYPWDNTGSHGGYSGYGAAPLFVGEFGTGNTADDLSSTGPGSQGEWFESLVEFIRDSSDAGGDATGLTNGGQAINDLSWGYWALNGNDSYALLNNDFNAVLYPEKLAVLCGIQSAGCGAGPTCGDNVCNGSEDCSSCPGDCGACPPPACDNDGTCESGEDCTTCSDCSGVSTGKPSSRYCCGNGDLESPEGPNGELCDGNY